MVVFDEQHVAPLKLTLEHHGIKGMHWGIRKERVAGAKDFTTKGIVARKDGSIEIAKGVSIQRLVSGKSKPLKDMTYASINEYDNARYIKALGKKSLIFPGTRRDTILSIKTRQAIKAPSVSEATKVVSNLILNNQEFREKNVHMFGGTIQKSDVEKIRADPEGKTARSWYEQTNIALSFTATTNPHADYVQNTIREAFVSKGYNALRDENDVDSISKTPIIIFNPQKTLKVVTQTQITDQVFKANKQQLKAYKANGKEWVDKQIYSS